MKEYFLIFFVMFDNKTVLIIGLIVIAIVALFFHYKDIALTISGGLVGYISKDAKDYAKK